MLRSLLYSVLLLVFVGLAAVFGALNPGPVALDFAFQAIQVEKSVALMVTLAVGWVFGLCCAGIAVLRLLSQRRALQRSLRLAEQEVQALRSLPVRDAD
ncbi:MAG: LapA family protein [Gammaproteobacteria bacterium]|nr:LapA family protein [Gammaproteobacteria bacterium]